jgi:hypothetical protein
MRSASAASTMRPVIRISKLRDRPTQRGSSQLTPMSQPVMPTFTKAALKRADCRRIADLGTQRQRQPATVGQAVDGCDHRRAQRAQLE